MARISRLVLENVAHHVVARGVGQMRIFRNGFDKRKYLMRFALIAEEEKVLVHAYCLMDNHVHLIVTPSDPNGLARLFRRMHTWWAMKLNRWLERSGHVFQNRFHSSPLDENHYWTAMRYVEVNPRRAGLRATRRLGTLVGEGASDRSTRPAGSLGGRDRTQALHRRAMARIPRWRRRGEGACAAFGSQRLAPLRSHRVDRRLARKVQAQAVLIPPRTPAFNTAAPRISLKILT